MYSYRHPRPAVATDIAAFGIFEGVLSLLLIERGAEPFRGRWALPGGFLRPDETLAACAARELAEETGLAGATVEPFATYSEPGRDPRGWVLSAAFFALLPRGLHPVSAGSDAARVAWQPVSALPTLAFDHDRIVADALAAMREAVEQRPLVARLLPARFTLSEWQAVTEVLLGRPLDKRNFRRRIMEAGWVEETDQYERGAHRPAMLYRPGGGAPGEGGS